MADQEVFETFKLECLQKRGYMKDFAAFCSRPTEKQFSNPSSPGHPAPVPKELFTTLPAVASLRYHNHPKTKSNWRVAEDMDD